MEIAGRVAVVTGASSGIGATVATDLARRGATVAAVARRKDKLDEIIDQCRQYAAASMPVPADISSREECERVIAEVEQRFGRVDILVNNAGISIHRNAARTTADDVERLMAVNFFAPMYLTTAAMAGMLERKQGSIVNITSVAGYVPNPGESAYGAAKAALSLWSHGLAVDLVDTGVQVTVISPGPIDTEIWGLPAATGSWVPCIPSSVARCGGGCAVTPSPPTRSSAARRAPLHLRRRRSRSWHHGNRAKAPQPAGAVGPVGSGPAGRLARLGGRRNGAARA